MERREPFSASADLKSFINPVPDEVKIDLIATHMYQTAFDPSSQCLDKEHAIVWRRGETRRESKRRTFGLPESTSEKLLRETVDSRALGCARKVRRSRTSRTRNRTASVRGILHGLKSGWVSSASAPLTRQPATRACKTSCIVDHP